MKLEVMHYVNQELEVPARPKEEKDVKRCGHHHVMDTPISGKVSMSSAHNIDDTKGSSE